ncbi:group 1 truncated hemoglobin [Massilia sp. CF038]|uniref:group I truncated hemoglobin n=1 Tax=Massilia sp. CF038 TaxID=1881045 RepID=UPI0009205F81|nr:group 1 truncated hemoglobin [Massilia sp. CF038]SHH46317.1 hemoglobin [Massilia sp. CF038]
MTTSLAKLVGAGMLAMATLGAAHAADDATFQGLGGKAGIKKIVATFIPLIQADPRIKESFTDIDMKNLALRLEEQFCVLSGGPCEYKGKDMKEIHDGLNITNAQFNALAEDLQIAMEQVGIASRYQNKLVAKLAPMQRDIVTK